MNLNILNFIGWLGALLLSICGLPQLLKTFKEKNVTGLSFGMLFCWWLGEVLTITYVLILTPKLPLIFNYLINIIIVTTLLILYCRYKNKS